MSAHGSTMRGLSFASRSPMFEGRFGQMFPWLHPALYGRTDEESFQCLDGLGEAMKGPDDAPKDGADEEESGIPALYTYLGQFIDHDLTFGPEGAFQKQKDVEALVDFRTPAFDLDCVYGRGPGDQPYLYDGARFLLGDKLHGAGDKDAADLPRNVSSREDFPRRALIGDPRNDENSIVSQLQGLFLRFHNRLIDEGRTFEQAQLELQRHYQYVILNDFLPAIVNRHVLNCLKTNNQFDRNKIRFYRPRKMTFMPVEFATAAYRFGHSMVRPGYRLNDYKENLLPIFANRPDPDLTGKYAMPENRAIDWGRFVDTEPRAYDGADGSEERHRRLQFAYKIDTSIVEPLSRLPREVAAEPPPSLAKRNLRRSFEFGLPSGQDVARAMGERVLEDHEILIGQALKKPVPKTMVEIGDRLKTHAFRGNCPLWVYILAEAMHHQAKVPVAGSEGGFVATPQLGPVGGRIVAEVFLGLMFADKTSLLSTNPNWTPESGADYRLRDFVLYSVGK